MLQTRRLVLSFALLLVAVVAFATLAVHLRYAEEFNVYGYSNAELAEVKKDWPYSDLDLNNPKDRETFESITSLAYSYAVPTVFTPEQSIIIPRKHWGVASPDTYDAFVPAERYLQLGTWTIDNNNSIGAHFYRPPAYGVIYLFFRLFFSVQQSFFMLVVLNFIGHLFVAWSVYRICGLLKLPFGWQIAGMLSFGLFPGFITFITWLMPELLSLAACMGVCLSLLQARQVSRLKHQLMYFFLAGFCLIVGTYLRPQVLLAGVVFLPAFYEVWRQHQMNWRPALLAMLAAGVFPLLIGGSWTLRNYQVSKSFVPINNYAYPDQRYVNKPELYALRDFLRVSHARSTDIVSSVLPFFRAGILGDTSAKFRRPIMALVKPAVLEGVGEQKVESTLQLYQRVLKEDYSPAWLSARPLPNPPTASQRQLTKRLQRLTNEAIEQAPLNYLTAPAYYAVYTFVHSFTSGTSFLRPPVRKQRIVFRLWHLIALALNLSFLLFWASGFLHIKRLLRRFNYTLLTAVWLLPMGFIVYMSVIMQHDEQRYILPFYALVVCGAVYQACFYTKGLLRLLKR